MVFFAHLVGAERDYGGGQTLLPSFLEMGVTGVDLFFLISGFVMVYITHTNTSDTSPKPKRHNPLKFLLRRISRIYPLYWVATLLLLFLYGGKYIAFGEATPLPNMVSSFLLAPHKDFPIIPVGWTLIHEMYFYGIFAAFLMLPLRLLPYLCGLWGLTVGTGYMAGLQGANAWTFVLFSPLTFEFLLGASIAWLALQRIIIAPRIILILAFVWLAALIIPFADKLYPDAVTDHGVRALIFALPFGYLLYASVMLEWTQNIIVPKWMTQIGDASYALYLIHIPVFLVIGKIVSVFTGNMPGPDWLDNILLLVLFFGVGLTAAIITHRYIEKPLIRYARTITNKLVSD